MLRYYSTTYLRDYQIEQHSIIKLCILRLAIRFITAAKMTSSSSLDPSSEPFTPSATTNTQPSSLDPTSQPFVPSGTTANTPPSLPQTYAQFSKYPFSTDSEWQAGLSSILGHPDTPTTEGEIEANPGLVLNAKLFYFARKFGVEQKIDAKGYVEWLRGEADQKTGQKEHIAAQPLATSENGTIEGTVTEAASDQAKSGGQEPPYPTSFAAIVDLITANKPVPGIEQIPNTVLEMGSSKIDKTQRRKKPWEKDDAANFALEAPIESAAEPSGVQGEDTQHAQGEGKVNGHMRKSEGAVKILQPNAIPSSGLLSND